MRIATIGLTLAGLLAVGAPVGAQTAQLTGTVTDQTGTVVQSPALTLTNRETRDRSNVSGDDAGRFEFAELEPGEYSFVASKPGFERRFLRLTLEPGEQRDEEVVLRLGSIEETINVTDTNEPTPPPVTISDDSLARARENRSRAGTILPPIKIRDQYPAYPASVSGSGFEGKVVLEGLVRTYGDVEVLQILAPVDAATMTTVYPDLARSAVEAVGGWRYEPTLLHGVPVDTRITITVNFRP